MHRMVTARSMTAELVRALAVLALVFLSFVHQPAAATGNDGFTATSVHEFCGSPHDEPAGHAPCHACRADPAVLPAPPATAEPAFWLVAAAPCRDARDAVVRVDLRSPANPRAPPAEA
jgi:hypothetical protein